jgi:hypothetical protein
MKFTARRAVPEVGECTVTLEVYWEDGKVICSVDHLEGWIGLPPKAWVRTIRAELAQIETIARDAGCDEIRLAGRNWSRVLPDYEPFKPVSNTNGLRKALT